MKPMPKPKVDLDQPIFPQGVIDVDEDSKAVIPPSEVTVKREKPESASGSGGVKPEDAAIAGAEKPDDAGQTHAVLQNRERSRSRRRSALKKRTRKPRWCWEVACAITAPTPRHDMLWRVCAKRGYSAVLTQFGQCPGFVEIHS